MKIDSNYEDLLAKASDLYDKKNYIELEAFLNQIYDHLNNEFVDSFDGIQQYANRYEMLELYFQVTSLVKSSTSKVRKSKVQKIKKNKLKNGKWIFHIEWALVKLGGTGNLKTIYNKVGKLRKAENFSIENLESNIKKEIYTRTKGYGQFLRKEGIPMKKSMMFYSVGRPYLGKFGLLSMIKK